MAPAAPLPSRWARPFTSAAPPTTLNETARAVPAGTVKERPETGEPFTTMETTEYARDAAPARTSYFPGTRSANVISRAGFIGPQATTRF